MSRVSQSEIGRIRAALDQLKVDNHSEPIVFIIWVVAGSNEPSYENCVRWEAREMEGSVRSFNRAIEESAADFRTRVGTELNAMSEQLNREIGFYQYFLSPIPD